MGPWSGKPVPISSAVGDFTGFYPQPPVSSCQLGANPYSYGASAVQIQAATIGLWSNALSDRITPGDAMLAGCQFEPEYSCPITGPPAFPTPNNGLRVGVDLQVPYDGTNHASSSSFAFAYLNLMLQSGCPSGIHASCTKGNPASVSCGCTKCADGRSNFFTLSIQLYDGRSPQVIYPSIHYDSYAGTPQGVSGPIAVDVVGGRAGFFSTVSGSFESAHFSGYKHFEVVLTPTTFSTLLQKIQATYPSALESAAPKDYRVIGVSLINELGQAVPPTQQDHAQLGLSFKNLILVSDGPSSADVIAINRNDAWQGKTGTGVHQLLSVTGYNTYNSRANGLTTLPPQNNWWSWTAGQPDMASGAYDLIGINTKDAYNGQSATGIHVLSAATGYTTFKVQTLTVLGQTDPNTWVFLPGASNANGLPDVIAINRFDSWNGKKATGIHILSGADSYQSWVGANGLSALGQTLAADWQFAVGKDNSGGGHLPDIIAVNVHDQNGRIGVHVLSGASQYQTFLLHNLTNIPSDSAASWVFVPGLQQPGLYRDLTGIDTADPSGNSALYIFSALAGYQVLGPKKLSSLRSATLPGWAFAGTPP